MEKGVMASVMGLMALGLIATAFIYLKPIELQEKNQDIYLFIEKTSEKIPRMMVLSDQAITEAIADAALDETNTATNPQCVLPLDFDEEIRKKLFGIDGDGINDATDGYFGEKINNYTLFPENRYCTVEIFRTGVSPGGNNSVDANFFTSLKCSLQKTGLNPLQPDTPQEIVSMQKKYFIAKRVISLANGMECKIRVFDIDSLKEFQQP